MALIDCPECGRKVSNSAPQCPGCGYLISDKENDSIFNKAELIKLLAFIICVIAIIYLIVFVRLETKNSSREILNYYPSTYSTEDSVNTSSIFRNLTMSNFISNLGEHGGEMTCEVRNNNDFPVKGYFSVVFYDKSGNLMYSQLMPLPSVESGEKVICSTPIPKDDYPTGYSYVEYSQSILEKD